MIPLALVLLSACLAVHDTATPRISIIIDDLGHRPRYDHAAIDLPGPLAYAILPYSPFARELAEAAQAAAKEVLLHIPMEAESENHLLGRGALDTTMPHEVFVKTLRHALTSVPYLSGVNNHMGSRLTRDLVRMRWLMMELRNIGNLVYVDSRTTPMTVAERAASEAKVPFIARDVFLDNRRDAAYIHAQIDALISHAHTNGEGVGIAHPHPETIAVLIERLTMLEGVRLVSLTELLRSRICEQIANSRAYSKPQKSRSPRAQRTTTR